MVNQPCKFNCGKVFAKPNGKCQLKHEEICNLNINIKGAANSKKSTNSNISSATLCSQCGISFIKIKSHKCKSNGLNYYNFSNDFFEDASHETNSNYLEICFLQEKVSKPKKNTVNLDNDFKVSVANYIKNSGRNKLTIGCININSILNKFHEISFLLTQNLVDVMIVNESRLDKSTDSSFFQVDNYHMRRRDRADVTFGGGVMVFYKKNLKVSWVKEDKELELITLIICSSDNYKLAVFGCYRAESQPYNKGQLFFDLLEKKINEVAVNVDNIVIVGDLNYDLNQNNNLLHNFCNEIDLTNVIEKNTHYDKKNSKSSLIDVILIMCMNIFFHSEVFNNAFSDHALILATIDFDHKAKIDNVILSRSLTE